jgi:multidrug resistance protein MdtO
MLLRRELDTRLQTVAQLLKRLAANDAAETAATDSLNSLATAGMSRPLALLKTSSLIHSWARARHEKLSALITLLDRLVTAAAALGALAPGAVERVQRERMLNAAEGCEQMRRAFAEMRLPARGEWTALVSEQVSGALSPLTDIERTLDQIALTVPEHSHDAVKSVSGPAEKRSLFLPDAFTNPEYVRFAIKGTLAAFICYFLFIGFDYPGIYTSVITCFVIALSTIGASNQKGILRFGGAAVGGVMGLIALVYLFPNVETIGGFWLVFGAGTAVAAWATFGTPRIFYGGYQTGLAFYKAVLQDFGPALSATVVRDRLIGVFFGLIVFGIVENLLWPVRARDALRARLIEMLRLLADLARSGTPSTIPTAIEADVDSWRRRISQKVQDAQEMIESSKFEAADFNVSEMQKVTADAQIIFVLLLSLARQQRDIAASNAAEKAARELDNAVATTLETLAARAAGGSALPIPAIEDRLSAFERAITDTDVLDENTAPHFAARLALYRTLVSAIERLDSESLNPAQDERNEQIARQVVGRSPMTQP